MAALELLSRWLHIIAATVAVGGPIFMFVALFPAASALSGDSRGQLFEGIRRRWSKAVMAAIGLLVISGLFNYLMILKAAKTWGPEWQAGQFNMKLYQALFGLKVTIAFAMFFIASALVGRSPGMAKFREHARYWAGVNVVLALVLILIASQLRMMHIGPNDAPPAVIQPAETPPPAP
jgi:uncharacterized membrane protein